MFDFEGRRAHKRAQEKAEREREEQAQRDTDNAAIALNKSLSDFFANNNVNLSVLQTGRIITITNHGSSKLQITVIVGPEYEFEIIPYSDPGFARSVRGRSAATFKNANDLVDAILNWAEL